MSGVFPANVQTALTKISGTSGPPTINQIANPQNAGAAGGGAPAAGAGDYNVAYTMQTGPIRYAPMAKPAPTKITAKGNARQFPTSAYSVWFKTGMPAPDATNTITNPYTYVTTSVEPTVSLMVREVFDTFADLRFRLQRLRSRMICRNS